MVAQAQLPPVKMAILGDSTVTGAATNPYLKPFFANLAGVLLVNFISPGHKTGRAKMRRETYSAKEYAVANEKGDLLSLLAESRLSRSFDTPEYSFAYDVGLGLGISPREMLLVAQDGQKVRSISRQLDRVMGITKDSLPPMLLISYGLNDICHPNDVGAEVAAFKSRFKQTVQSQISEITRLKPNEKGTVVFISAPLDATNLMDNDELMSQIIPFEGASLLDLKDVVTCTQLRDKSFARQTIPGQGLRNAFIGMCKGLRQDVNDPKARVEKVRQLQNAQIEAWKEVLAETQVPGFKFILAESVRKIRFTAGDLANDCFHPSVSAHRKIANQFLTNELKDLHAVFDVQR
jgi:hypothetical protein